MKYKQEKLDRLHKINKQPVKATLPSDNAMFLDTAAERGAGEHLKR